MSKHGTGVHFWFRFVAILGMAGWMAGCTQSDGGGRPAGRPATLVDVEPVVTGTITATTSATGTITAKDEVKIIAQAEGKIEKLAVEEGDRVTAGQLIVQLDASVLSAQTREAEANMTEARLGFERARSLMDSKLVSQQDFDQARTRFDVAKARYELQRALLSYTRITSPISGVVTFRGARVGDVAVPRSTLLVVTDPRTLVIEITVSELDIPKISIGDPSSVTVDAYPAETFGGRVRRVFPSSDPVSRLVRVEIELTQKSDRLIPGMFARAQLTTARRDRALLVSNDALLTTGTGETYAFVVRDSVVERVTIRTGIRAADVSEIVAGAVEGDRLVVAGQSALNDGMRVSVTRERKGRTGGNSGR